MFTGIIEAAGVVQAIELGAEGARLVIAAPDVAPTTAIGDSVAVNGVCLTAVEIRDEQIAFDAITETLRRTNLGQLAAGQKVNLERPLRANGRFDGHVVQGHVDGTAELVSVTEEGVARRLRLRVPESLLRYVVEKGSVTLDGISLTVAAVGPDWLEVAIIPHTWQVTNLGQKSAGDTVNVEVDILAKYVERLLAGRGA